MAAPFKQTEFDIIYGEGISLEGELLALGEKLGVIEKSGTSYTYKPEGKEEVKLGRGYDASRVFMRDNTKMRDAITKDVRRRMKDVVMESSSE